MTHSITNFEDDLSLKLFNYAGFDLTSAPPAEWEVKYFQQYGVRHQTLRAILQGTMRAMRYEERRVLWTNYRYYYGFFDSVGETFFVIVDVKIPTLTKLPPPYIVQKDGWDVQVPFRCSLVQQHEVAPANARYSNCHDLTYLQLQTMRWEDVSMREKLNGTPMFSVKYAGKKYLMGFGMAIQIPKTCPIKMIEWTPEGVFVLFPYALPTCNLSGIDFVCHNWITVDAVAAQTYSHGVVFCVEGREYRSRVRPSLEVDVGTFPSEGRSGVWEVASGPVFLRPRPGRVPIKYERAKEQLTFAVPMCGLELPVSVNRIVMRVAGPYEGSYGKCGDQEWYDSGIRVVDGQYVVASRMSMKEEVMLCNDVYNITFPEGIVISPVCAPVHVNVVSGAKVLLYDHDGGTYLIKDGDKSLDMIGGKIEVGESSFDALAREIQEETGLTGLQPRFVGVSPDISDKRVHFYSYVYIAPVLDHVRLPDCLFRFQGYNYNYDKCMPWLPRLIGILPQNVLLSSYYLRLDIPVFRPRRRLYQKKDDVEERYKTHKVIKKYQGKQLRRL